MLQQLLNYKNAAKNIVNWYGEIGATIKVPAEDFLTMCEQYFRYPIAIGKDKHDTWYRFLTDGTVELMEDFYILYEGCPEPLVHLEVYEPKIFDTYFAEWVLTDR